MVDVMARESAVDKILEEIRLFYTSYDAIAYLKAEITCMQRKLKLVAEYEEELGVTKFAELFDGSSVDVEAGDGEGVEKFCDAEVLRAQISSQLA